MAKTRLEGKPAASRYDPKSSPFFVVGCGRSGTSLLRSMLTSHPDIAIPVESLFILDYLRASQSVSIETLARLLINDYEFKEWDLPLELSDLADCKTAKELIDRIHRLYLEQQGKSVWGQKTPRFVRFGVFLKNYYPHARFIHVIRDPRAVANSLINSDLHRSNAYYAAVRWRRDVQMGLDLSAQYPGDVLEIFYEDLVRQPEKTLRLICTFLNLEFNPSMLTYHHEGLKDYSPFFDHAHAKLNEPPRVDRIEAWRNKLTTREIELVEAICWELMQQAGYQPDSKSPQLDQRYRRRLKRQRWLGLAHQIFDRVTRRFWPLFSFVWRKIRLGVFFQDMRDVNY
jgi:hypothetical protein